MSGNNVNLVKLSTLGGGTLFICKDEKYGEKYNEQYLKLDSPAQNDAESSFRQAVCTKDGGLAFSTCDDPLVLPLRTRN